MIEIMFHRVGSGHSDPHDKVTVSAGSVQRGANGSVFIAAQSPNHADKGRHIHIKIDLPALNQFIESGADTRSAWIATAPESAEIVGIVNFQDRCILATKNGAYEVKGEEVIPLKFVEEKTDV